MYNNLISPALIGCTVFCRDFDAAESVTEKMNKVKSVKGVKGLVKLAKEIAVTATTGNYDNEFIGQCRIPLQVIFSLYIFSRITNI